MRKATGCLAAVVTLTLSQIASAQINGSLDAGEYGPALAAQTVNTGFGDNTSELNAAYGVVLPNGAFKMLLTGNMEANGNGFVIFVDGRAGGAVATTLPDGSGLLGNFGGRYSDDWGGDTDGGSGVTPPAGGPSILDAGFNPERSIETNLFETNYYINVIDMTVANDDLPNRDVYIGTNLIGNAQADHPYLRDNGATPAGQISDAFVNTNTAGVSGDPGAPVVDPLTATTGYELQLDAAFINATPLQPLRFLPFITNGGGDFLANQFLPGLPGLPGNLGGPGDIGGTPLFDASTFAGNQYIEVALPTYTGGSSNYSTAVFNWPTPNGVNTSAVFGAGSASTGGTVTLDVPVTLGGLRFNSGGAYTIAGPSQLTLDTFSATARVDVVTGSHTVSAPVVINKSVEFSAAAGASVALTNVSYLPGLNVSKTGAGTVSVSTVQAASLSISGGTLKTTGASKVNSLAIDGGATPTAKLDLSNTGIVLDYTTTSPIANIRDLIVAGRAGGAWTGNGITSSNAAATSSTHAVGYAEASAVGITTFLGQSVDADAVLVRYTRLGDANLSGVTDIADFSLLGSNFNGVNTGWAKGDFNYDGKTDIGDFSLLASQFNQSAGDLPRGSAVPEPTLFGLIGMALIAARRRRA